MIILETKDYDELSLRALEILIAEINSIKNIKIGFATGETPLGLYSLLVKAYKKKKVDFSGVISYNLDEYYPIKKENKNSYYYYMHKNLFDHVNIKKKNINLLNGETEKPILECLNYESDIRKNPIDIQILGIGENGHVAFDEPGSSRNSRTRIVNLSEETRKINSRFFKKIDDVPKKALTMGLATIMKSNKILLLASGKSKAKAVYQLVNCRVSKKWPVTFLKKHKNLILIIDKDAGRLLK
jgi:glucosamine-6-phosphate deaminase